MVILFFFFGFLFFCFFLAEVGGWTWDHGGLIVKHYNFHHLPGEKTFTILTDF